jgi:hypothetical protein
VRSWRWEPIRAALLAVVLLVHGLAASPMPRSVKRSQFDTPIGKEEMDRWVGILGTIGVPISREKLSDDVYAVGSFFAGLRGALLDPFKPWFRVTGTGQGWGLFTYPDSFPHQLVVEVHTGAWRTVYAGLDPDAGWMRDQLAYRRIRGVYDGNTRKPGPSYDTFVAWVAARAFADFPDADQARIGFVRLHSTAPGVPKDSERSPRFQRTVHR